MEKYTIYTYIGSVGCSSNTPLGIGGMLGMWNGNEACGLIGWGFLTYLALCIHSFELLIMFPLLLTVIYNFKRRKKICIQKRSKYFVYVLQENVYVQETLKINTEIGHMCISQWLDYVKILHNMQLSSEHGFTKGTSLIFSVPYVFSVQFSRWIVFVEILGRFARLWFYEASSETDKTNVVVLEIQSTVRMEKFSLFCLWYFLYYDFFHSKAVEDIKASKDKELKVCPVVWVSYVATYSA